MKTLRSFGFLGLLGVLTLIGSARISAQTPDDNIVPNASWSDVLDVTAFECMMFAQASDDKPPMDHSGRGRRGMDAGRKRKHLEQLRMLKMLELLELREDQEIEFLTAYNAMRREHRSLDDQINASLDTLSGVLRSPEPSDETILRLCEQVSRLDTEKKMIGVQFARKAGDVLSVQQMGRLVVFEKRFESKMLENISRFRQGGGRGPMGTPEDEG